ncbi:MAG: DUF2783 domain-containing protein [Hyphomicrobiaceae bacterium]|nr:DUF2783 domain-containing protein [Hyphomicrobiaceae bacterium]
MALKRHANIADADGIYAALIEAYADLTERESLELSARLILVLANHIGDPALLSEAIATARKSIERPS